MRQVGILSAREAVNLVGDNDTVVVCGCEYSLARYLLALSERFVETGAPRNSLKSTPSSLGWGRAAVSSISHPGLVARAIGSGFSFLKTSAYSELLRQGRVRGMWCRWARSSNAANTAAGRDMTLTRVGLDTFVDPAMEGGRMNTATPGSLARRIEVGATLVALRAAADRHRLAARHHGR